MKTMHIPFKSSLLQFTVLQTECVGMKRARQYFSTTAFLWNIIILV
jgi:hypothetical protein